MHEDATSNSSDPYVVLGLGLDADEKAIRSAYLEKIKAFPPEREPEQFERIRDAYALLRDPRRRIKYMLFHSDRGESFADLLTGSDRSRVFVGPELWLKALSEKT